MPIEVRELVIRVDVDKAEDTFQFTDMSASEAMSLSPLVEEQPPAEASADNQRPICYLRYELENASADDVMIDDKIITAPPFDTF